MRLGCDHCEVWFYSEPYSWGEYGSAELMYARRINERSGLIRMWDDYQNKLSQIKESFYELSNGECVVSRIRQHFGGWLEVHTKNGGGFLFESGIAKRIMEGAKNEVCTV